MRELSYSLSQLLTCSLAYLLTCLLAQFSLNLNKAKRNLVIFMLELWNLIWSTFGQWVRYLAHFLSHLLTCSFSYWLTLAKNLRKWDKSSNIDAKTFKFGMKHLWTMSEILSSLYRSFTHLLTCFLAHFSSTLKENEINMVILMDSEIWYVAS